VGFIAATSLRAASIYLALLYRSKRALAATSHRIAQTCNQRRKSRKSGTLLGSGKRRRRKAAYGVKTKASNIYREKGEKNHRRSNWRGGRRAAAYIWRRHRRCSAAARI
jgi:hypothetical protein